MHVSNKLPARHSKIAIAVLLSLSAMPFSASAENATYGPTDTVTSSTMNNGELVTNAGATISRVTINAGGTHILQGAADGTTGSDTNVTMNGAATLTMLDNSFISTLNANIAGTSGGTITINATDAAAIIDSANLYGGANLTATGLVDITGNLYLTDASKAVIQGDATNQATVNGLEVDGASTADIGQNTALTTSLVYGSGVLNLNSETASATKTSVYDGGVINNNKGALTDTIVDANGTLNVGDGSSAATATDTKVLAGGIADIKAGATATETTVTGGTVTNAGTVNTITVDATGTYAATGTVGSAAVTNDATISGTATFDGFTETTNLTLNDSATATFTATDSSTLTTAIVTSGATLGLNGGITADSVTTEGTVTLTSTDALSKAIMTNSTINGGTVDINTNGEVSSSTITAGTVNVNTDGVLSSATVNGGAVEINTGGEVNGGSITTGTVNVNSGGLLSSFTVDGGTVAVLASGNSNTLTVNTGTIDIYGTDTDSIFNAGTIQNVYAGGVTNNVTATGATLNINGGTANGATLSSSSILNVTNSGVLSGTISADSSTINVDTGADVNSTADVVLNNSPINFNSGSAYAFNSLSGTSGTVNFNSAPYSTLTLGSLSGSMLFNMRTEVANTQGDFVKITGNATGSHSIFVQDTGVSPASANQLDLVSQGSGDAAFALTNSGGVVDLGTYQYTLANRAEGTDGKIWYLTTSEEEVVDPTDPGTTDPTDPGTTDPTDPGTTDPTDPGTTDPTNPGTTDPTDPGTVDPGVTDPGNGGGTTPPVVSPSTSAVLSMANVAPTVSRAEMGAVADRMNDILPEGRALWAQYLGNRFDISSKAGAGYRQYFNGLFIGMDDTNRLDADNGNYTWGGFVGYSHSDISFFRGGTGKADSWSVGIYNKMNWDNGWYLNSVAKYNRFDNEVNARMNSGGRAYGSYNTNGFTLAAETGRHIQVSQDVKVTPFASLMGFTSDSSSYALSNGMEAKVNSAKSLVGSAGARVSGKKIFDNGAEVRPFLSLSVEQEFVKDNKVTINQNDTFKNDISGTRGVVQVGVNADLNKKVSVSASAGYLKGRHIEAPWMASLTVSYKF